MTPTDFAFLAMVPAVLVAMGLTARTARTAPAPFAAACIASLAACTTLVLHGIGRDFAPWMTMLMTSFVLCIVTLTWLVSVMSAERAAWGYDAQGEDDGAIAGACLIHHQADAAIAAFDADRKRMSWFDRFRDSFVTTTEEERIAEQHGRRAGALAHLERIVRPWYDGRVETLVDGDGARPDVETLKRDLAPLAAAEDTARHVHELSIDAMNALNTAISSLDTAQTYETLDAVSSNKGIALVSSMQNSSASTDVQNANVAIARLSEASRQAIDSDLAVHDDTFDLILDMAVDSAFDFMSFYNVSRLRDAEARCRAAWDRVASIEPALRTALETAIATAQPARNRLDARLQPYREAALHELPTTAKRLITETEHTT